MKGPDRVDHLADDLDRLIDRHRQEYHTTYAEAVGVLEMKKYLLCAEAAEIGREDSYE